MKVVAIDLNGEVEVEWAGSHFRLMWSLRSKGGEGWDFK